MNVHDERTTSCWMDISPRVDAAPLAGDAECDIMVIGSGIAGLSNAYELARFGRDVIVIDRGGIGTGMTARTTAHLTSELDDRYSELIRVRGEDEARLFHHSQVAAINRIETICHDEGIDADFARLDGYLFAAEDKDRADLEEEFDACRKLGVDVEWIERAPVPGVDTGRALRFPDQGRFHPTKYLAGLANAIGRLGGRFHSDTAHVSDRETADGVEITTDRGFVIRARAAIFATNSPTNDKVTIHTKQRPDRTYVIAGRVAKGSVPDALVWDSCDAYHYVRIQPFSDAEDLLIVGGEDHRSGEVNDMDERLARLDRWTREHYPSFSGAQYRWSGQVLETIDFMPFSGRNPGNANVYIHTGDSGQGITNAVAGSLTILPLIIGDDSRYADLLDPSRRSLSSATSLKEFARGQAGAARNWAEYLTPGEIDSADDLEAGEGAVLREGLSKVAVYKAADGTIVRRSAICTHMGCLVHWNSLERCWDCPCHGSQFAPGGEVLNGPAVTALGEAK